MLCNTRPVTLHNLPSEIGHRSLMATNYETNADGKQQNVRTRERNRTLDWEGIESEGLLTLKQSRGALKGNVTKAHA